MLLITDDERKLAIDLTTGRQSESKERCSVVLLHSRRADDPRDPRDYGAPRGIESYRCGGVTVMGSENYTVADPCRARAHIDPERLDGLTAHRLWKLEPGWLVFGVRKPGTHVPMVGLVSHGKLVWKAEVPPDNPLEAEDDSPEYVALAGSAAIASYALSKDRRTFVSALSVADGSRLWTVALPARVTSLSMLDASRDRVFIQADDELFLLDAANGQTVATISNHEPR